MRLRLAEVLLASGDPHEAGLEAVAAEKAFMEMHADALAERCRELRRRIGERAKDGTARS